MNKSPNNTSVTVGICAFNEAKSIGALIHSILQQKLTSCHIERILIVNDMSTDLTAQIVRKIAESHSIVELYNQPVRSGKSSGLNYIFKHVTSDLLVTFDADVQLKSSRVIENIADLLNREEADLICGRVDPLPASAYFGEIVYTYELFWRYVIDSINGGSNIHRCLGCCIGYSKRLYSNIRIPAQIQADDHYVYLLAKSKEMKTAYSAKAEVGYKVPERFSDYIKQFSRYTQSKASLESVFGPNTEVHYFIPPLAKINAYMKAFHDRPFLMSLACLLQGVQRLSLLFKTHSGNNLWTTIQSTK